MEGAMPERVGVETQPRAHFSLCGSRNVAKRRPCCAEGARGHVRKSRWKAILVWLSRAWKAALPRLAR